MSENNTSSWSNVGHDEAATAPRKNPVRVASAEHNLTEWDDTGDKNYAYYSGDRMFTTPSARKMTAAAKAYEAVVAWWSGPQVIDNTMSPSLRAAPSTHDKLI